MASLTLMGLPMELLFMIVKHATTPLDDMAPLDEKSFSSVKSLSLVNKTLHRICVQLSIHHVRVWGLEDRLANRLMLIWMQDQHILSSAKSLSIRSIGPAREIPTGTRAAAQNKPAFIQQALALMTMMPHLTELRLVTDNGRYSMEPVLRKLFCPRQRTFPAVRTLYLRTTTSMSSIFACFPGLRAINFNMNSNLGSTSLRTRHAEVEALQQHNKQVRTLGVLRYGKGWDGPGIAALLVRFPDIECLFLEGTIVPHTWRQHRHTFPGLFRNHQSLRRLVITDELYVVSNHAYQRTLKLDPADPDDLTIGPRAWPAVAAAFFAAAPLLEEFAIGRRVDFKARVYRRPIGPAPPPSGPSLAPARPPAPVARALPVAAPAPARPRPPFLVPVAAPTPRQLLPPVRAYDDLPGKARLNYPPSFGKWSLRRTEEGYWEGRWGALPVNPAQHGRPDDAVAYTFADIPKPLWAATGRGVSYAEMVRDRCETSFWEAEWLRVVRG